MLPLPALTPDVTNSLSDPSAPFATKHRTDVSDTHSLASHPVPPIRPDWLDSQLPIPPPCTVTDVLPVPGRLATSTLDDDGRSADTASVIDPARAPTVISTRNVPSSPLDCWQTTDVSDTHVLASHPDPPTRPVAVLPP